MQTKRVEMTDKVRGMISRVTDDGVNPDTVAVYECIAVTTMPLSKPNTLFDGGRLDSNTLYDMANVVNGGSKDSVPLHTLHMQSYELPVGKLIGGMVTGSAVSPGDSELRTLFYVPLTETDIINKLDGGTLDEVSIGLRSNSICCSECNFDYMGPDSSFDNLWNCQCNEGHTIGEKGVYAKISGVNRWMELSLVPKGASQNSKIVSRTKQLMGASYSQIAASGASPELTTLFAEPTPIAAKPKGNLNMDLDTLNASLVETKVELQLAKAKVTELSAAHASQADTITSLNSEVETLKKSDSAVKVTELETKLAAVEPASVFLKDESNRLSVMMGLSALADTAPAEEHVARITEARVKLSASFPAGGVAAPAGDVNASAKADNKTWKAPK